MTESMASGERVRPYPGLTLLVMLGLGAMVAGLLLVLSMQWWGDAPPASTAPWVAEENKRRIGENIVLATAVMVSVGIVMALGFLTFIGAVIARLVTKRDYPALMRPNALVRLVLPAGLIVVVLALLSVPVVMQVRYSGLRAAREKEYAAAQDQRAAEMARQQQLQQEARRGDLERRLRELRENVEKLATAQGEAIRNVLQDIERERNLLPEAPADLKERALGILDKRQGEMLAVNGAYPPMMAIYSVLDGAKAEKLRALWENNRVEYVDPKSAEAHGLARDLARAGKFDLIARLLERGFDPLEEMPPYRVSLWTVAVESNRPVLLEMLLKRGVKPDTKIENDRWPLEYQCAITGSDLEMVRLLLVHGADVNRKGYQERTALHHAAGRTNEAMVKLLLEHKADVNALDKEGKTALDIAEGRKAQGRKVAELLMKHGGKRAREIAPK